MPVVLLRADEFGVTGDESPAELEARADLTRRVEQIRLARRPADGARRRRRARRCPKMFLLSPPRSGGAISTRAFIPRRVHTSIGVLMAASVAAGISIPGAVGADIADAARPTARSGSSIRAARSPRGCASSRTPDGTWRGDLDLAAHRPQDLRRHRLPATPPADPLEPTVGEDST